MFECPHCGKPSLSLDTMFSHLTEEHPNLTKTSMEDISSMKNGVIVGKNFNIEYIPMSVSFIGRGSYEVKNPEELHQLIRENLENGDNRLPFAAWKMVESFFTSLATVGLGFVVILAAIQGDLGTLAWCEIAVALYIWYYVWRESQGEVEAFPIPLPYAVFLGFMLGGLYVLVLAMKAFDIL